MSKTIEEIIEEYTKYRISGVANFNEMISKSLMQPKYHVKKIAERYAQSQTQELIEQKRDLVDMLEECVSVLTWTLENARPDSDWTTFTNSITNAIVE